MAFVSYISLVFGLDAHEIKEILAVHDAKKPNANGFDIDFVNSNCRILAEIKSTVPINRSDKFGIAQINSILDDAIKLKYGGKTKMNTSEAYKFIGIIDMGKSTDLALQKVFNERILRTKNELRESRNLIKTQLEILNPPVILLSLSKDKIYIIKILLE